MKQRRIVMKKIIPSLISLLLLLILPSCGGSAFSATECNNFREYEKLLADPRLPENFVRYESLSSAGTFQSLKLNDTLENMLSNEEECLGYTYTLEDKNGEIIPITVLHHSNGCSHQSRETLDFKYLCTRDEWTIGQYWYAVEELPLSSYDFNEEDREADEEGLLGKMMYFSDREHMGYHYDAWGGDLHCMVAGLPNNVSIHVGIPFDDPYEFLNYEFLEENNPVSCLYKGDYEGFLAFFSDTE